MNRLVRVADTRVRDASTDDDDDTRFVDEALDASFRHFNPEAFDRHTINHALTELAGDGAGGTREP